jgi:hypothetical protein
MNQQSLFADPPSAQLPPHCRSRRDDPESSRLAGASHASKAATHKALLLDAVRRHPGKTSAELAVLVGLERHESGRRLSDLKNTRRVWQGAMRRCAQNGTTAVTWWPTQTGDRV